MKLASEKAILSAHDVSDGGLAVALTESCFDSDGLSADVKLEATDAPAQIALFGERGARAVVSVAPTSLARVNAIAAQCGVKAQTIGRVTPGEFRIESNGVVAIRGGAESFQRAWAESLGKTIESA